MYRYLDARLPRWTAALDADDVLIAMSTTASAPRWTLADDAIFAAAGGGVPPGIPGRPRCAAWRAPALSLGVETNWPETGLAASARPGLRRARDASIFPRAADPLGSAAVATPCAHRLVHPLMISGMSFAAIFVRLALPAPPVVTGFYRMSLAALPLGAWLWWRGVHVPWRGRAARFALVSGACFGTDLAFWHISIVETTVGLATLLVNLTPVHLGVYAVLVRRERGLALRVGAAWRCCMAGCSCSRAGGLSARSAFA